MAQSSQFLMLALNLQIQDPFLLEALGELFLQSDIQLVNTPEESEAILTCEPSLASDLPYASLSSLHPPFRILDLLALVQNLPYTQTLSFAHFHLNIRDRNLINLKKNETYRLTGKECQLLKFFYTHKEREISKDDLLKTIWNYHPQVATHTLETHIYRLRQKLEDNPTHPQILLNCREGYLFKINPNSPET